MRTDEFVERHIGPNEEEIKQMLSKIGAKSIEQLLEETIPEAIRLDENLDLPDGISENAFFKTKLSSTILSPSFLSTESKILWYKRALPFGRSNFT